MASSNAEKLVEHLTTLRGRDREDEQEYFAKVRALKLHNLYDVGRLIVQQGLRPEEAMRIRKTDVDLVNGTLRIEYGKTKAARRRLYLTPESAVILSARLHSHGPWIFPSPRRAGEPLERLNYAHDKVLDELSAAARVRQYLSEQAESTAALPRQRGLHIWYRDGLALLDKLASAQPAGLRFVIYDLRHTFATRLAEAGVDLATLAAILGHSSLRMVMRYVHPTEQHQRTAMEKAVRFWSGTEQRQKPSVVIERDSTRRPN